MTERIPVVLTGQALQSLRESGYTLAAALGEVIDNALDANANYIVLRMDESRGTERGKKAHVHRIAFADDGEGMDDEILHHYPQIGYSTRYMRTDTIGKFGVGAKLAALNFGKRIDIWSRPEATSPWKHVHFDLDEALEGEKRGDVIGIDPPAEDPVPSDLRDLLPDGRGTLVVWSKVTRLEHGRHAKDFNTLRLEVEKELSRIFRVFLHNGIRIEVNGQNLLPHDPLFLMDGTWAEKNLREYYERGEGSKSDLRPTDDDFDTEVIKRKDIKVAGHVAWLTVTLYPKAVTRGRGKGNDTLAKALRVPDNLGSISFMRLDREISYTNVPRIFSRAVDDPDRFIGIEVSFTPELDDYFGVRNVKRGAEPHDELREKLRNELKSAIAEARRKLDERWGKVARDLKTHVGEHGPITERAAEVNRTMPKSRATSEVDVDDAYEHLAEDVLGEGAQEEVKQQYLEKTKELPFVVESVSFPGKQFIEVQHVAGKIIIRLNTRHRFYREMWEPLKMVADAEGGTMDPAEAIQAARRTVEALTLLLISYGKAESMNENPIEQYGELRDYWGMFLDSLLTRVKDVV